MIEIRGLTKRVPLAGGPDLDILRGVDLDLGAGEVVAIVGRSGSGKSTLLNLVGLLDTYDSGSYRIGDADVGAMADPERSALRGSTFGFVFQQFHLLSRRNALDNVAAPLAHAPVREYSRRSDRARKLLGAVGLVDRLGSLPSQLSGGEQQRVAIARALVRHPRIILADEPTGSLDTANGEAVLRLLLTLARDSRTSLLLVTHDDVVAAAADRRLQLLDGRLVPR